MPLEKMVPLMIEGIQDTLYMTLVSTAFAYLLGLPLAIALVLTSPKGLTPRPIIYRVLDAVVNIFRSIPFLILMILVIPLTRLIAGKAFGQMILQLPEDKLQQEKAIYYLQSKGMRVEEVSSSAS